MKSRNLSILPILLIAIFALFACTIFIGGPNYPDYSIPISTEAADEFLETIHYAATSGIETGSLTIIVTESQITSFLAMKLAEQPKPFFANPQIYLQNDQIQVFGTARKGYFEATGAIFLTAQIDETGSMQIEVYSIDLGPLSVPDGITESITNTIEEAFTGSIGPVATGIRLTGVTIEEGVMKLTGVVR